MIAQIIPRLYLSGQAEAHDLTLRKQLGIQAIVTLCSPAELTQRIDDKTGLSRYSIVALLDDDKNSKHLYEMALHWIRESHFTEKLVTLVHCSAGCSRSPSLVAAYLWKIQEPIGPFNHLDHATMEQAMDYVISQYQSPLGPGPMRFSPVWRQIKKLFYAQEG